MSGEQDTPSDTGTFHPADISVRVGDIVEWDYSPAGLPPHNIVFADAESLSNRLGLGVKPDGTSGAGTWQVRFILPGTYLYRCTFHPGMNGMVTVGG
jgi:plastocyanin